MPYPQPTDDDVAFFEAHGWIAIDDAVDPADLELLAERCEVILEKKQVMAFDWAWEKGNRATSATSRSCNRARRCSSPN